MTPTPGSPAVGLLVALVEAVFGPFDERKDPHEAMSKLIIRQRKKKAQKPEMNKTKSAS
jgi:hypothetical protein